jgi:hypothetical protein
VDMSVVEQRYRAVRCWPYTLRLLRAGLLNSNRVTRSQLINMLITLDNGYFPRSAVGGSFFHRLP